MASKTPTNKDPLFRKALADFQRKWPDVVVTARDRAAFNKTMLEVNKRAKRKKKRKKKLAT